MSAALIAEAWAKFPRFPPSGGEDQKFWARRIVYRVERGDKSLMPVQVDFAYTALELEKPDAP